MKLWAHPALLVMGIVWCVMLVWMTIQIFCAPEAVEDRRGFRAIGRRRQRLADDP